MPPLIIFTSGIVTMIIIIICRDSRRLESNKRYWETSSKISRHKKDNPEIGLKRKQRGKFDEEQSERCVSCGPPNKPPVHEFSRSVRVFNCLFISIFSSIFSICISWIPKRCQSISSGEIKICYLQAVVVRFFLANSFFCSSFGSCFPAWLLIFVNLIQKANKICVGILLDLPERSEKVVVGAWERRKSGKEVKLWAGVHGASGHWGLDLIKEPGNQIFDELYELQLVERRAVEMGVFGVGHTTADATCQEHC
uniref:HDC19641 n=1 Tax=Drosophila melanogaster TaxID=7227 RepID=Q6II63_DROME|nr:TPA_inf: HDC19641 [Drosophila melanogaster]